MSYLTANDRPGVHAPSWYADSAGEQPARSPVNDDGTADVCVVGAGYAGLSVALRLVENGLSVKVLEANRVGWGASGRNGGQLGVGPRADIEAYERAVGPDDARKVWEIAFSANELCRELIARHGIDCDLRDGYVDCCWRPKEAKESQEYAEHVATRYGHPKITPLDRESLAEHLGTHCFHGGFFDEQAGHLHPLKFALGLAQAAERAGAEICEMSRVTRIDAGAVHTGLGSVKAPVILLACNGYLDGLHAPAQRRMLPINNYIIATEPLPEDMANRINPNRVCAADSRFVVNYFRLSPDSRMLWGGGESTGRKFPSDIEGMVRPRMLEVYPELAPYEVTHAWGGTLAITGTRMPLFYQSEQGVRVIGGWSGSGVHMATMGGKIAADAVLGDVDDWNVLARVPTPQFPGGDWFRMPLLRAAMFWYGLRDRL